MKLFFPFDNHKFYFSCRKLNSNLKNKLSETTLWFLHTLCSTIMLLLLITFIIVLENKKKFKKNQQTYIVVPPSSWLTGYFIQHTNKYITKKNKTWKCDDHDNAIVFKMSTFDLQTWSLRFWPLVWDIFKAQIITQQKR